MLAILDNDNNLRKHSLTNLVDNPNFNISNVLFCDKEFVTQAINHPNEFIIIDARPRARFHGTEPEPRNNLVSGHIPNSINIPFERLIKNGKFIEKNEIYHIFDSLKIKKNSKIIFTCGSGVTACILAVASRIIGYNNTYVYDGSWSEWGKIGSNNLIETYSSSEKTSFENA